MLNQKLLDKLHDSVDRFIVLDKYIKDTIEHTNINTEANEPKKMFSNLIQNSQSHKSPKLLFNYMKYQGKNENIHIENISTPKKKSKPAYKDNNKDKLSPNIGRDNLLNQSNCITIRNSNKKLRKRNISFESR